MNLVVGNTYSATLSWGVMMDWQNFAGACRVEKDGNYGKTKNMKIEAVSTVGGSYQNCVSTGGTYLAMATATLALTAMNLF
jgi:hypothetical protein